MNIDPDFLMVITSAEIGDGPQDLGERLTDLCLKCLVEGDTLPARMIFLNSGIFLTTEGSAVLGHLEKFESMGTEIVSCITCLKYHDRMERVAVGTAGDMTDTVQSMASYPKVVTL